jgi:hypothetical protein
MVKLCQDPEDLDLAVVLEESAVVLEAESAVVLEE